MIVYTDIKLRLLRPIVAKKLFFSLLVVIIGQFVVNFFSTSSKQPMNTADQRLEKKINVEQSAINKALRTPFFGDYVPKDLNEADVKQSMLNLTVVGIMFAPRDDASSVIIQSSSGLESTYHIGDTVPGGALIKKIMPDGVFVERNGTLESLRLPIKSLHFEAPASPLRSQ